MAKLAMKSKNIIMCISLHMLIACLSMATNVHAEYKRSGSCDVSIYNNTVQLDTQSTT